MAHTINQSLFLRHWKSLKLFSPSLRNWILPFAALIDWKSSEEIVLTKHFSLFSADKTLHVSRNVTQSWNVQKQKKNMWAAFNRACKKVRKCSPRISQLCTAAIAFQYRHIRHFLSAVISFPFAIKRRLENQARARATQIYKSPLGSRPLMYIAPVSSCSFGDPANKFRSRAKLYENELARGKCVCAREQRMCEYLSEQHPADTPAFYIQTPYTTKLFKPLAAYRSRE